ncbi:hypothetical protein D1B33_00255 [Lysinibacillus yapensis]|uniref:Uncharacterized protein n=1 Tax=Ureibacillus yapensis TaxID=2304605 RepID=A0A396SGB0_9BACL|nr:hypothetical protein D1B33_00255 [Lysinibacillus yapensis]
MSQPVESRLRFFYCPAAAANSLATSTLFTKAKSAFLSESPVSVGAERAASAFLVQLRTLAPRQLRCFLQGQKAPFCQPLQLLSELASVLRFSF